jgi:hypothetical protein
MAFAPSETVNLPVLYLAMSHIETRECPWTSQKFGSLALQKSDVADLEEQND